ncbi:MAG TPA: ABC transporter permease, partial [Vicinamibacterales bacterium]|nr:ABC transporter permease [Vicinamibacterales bacterium]
MIVQQWWIDVRARLGALFGRRRLQSRADEELQFHLTMLEQRLVDSGVHPTEARIHARRQFGNITLLRERTLDSWRYAFIDTLVRDLRYAVRTLRKYPGFSGTAILILTVSIGASTAIFSAFDALVLRPLPYTAPEQLVEITENYTRFDITGMQLAAVELDDLRTMTGSFSYVAGIRSGQFTLTGSGAAQSVPGLQVSAGIFPMLDVQPILGSPFWPDEEEYGKHRVVVISEGLWRRRFGADPNIVGTSIEINREPYRVAAVAHTFLGYLGTAWDLWVPLSFQPSEKAPATRGVKGVDGIARLKPGVTMAAATQELAAVTDRLAKLYPQAYPADAGFSLNAAGLASTVADNLRQPLLFLLAAVGVLMLIGCANVSNLLMARASARRKEISVRVAIGASRARVVGQLMTESLVLAGVSGALGVAFAAFLLRLFELYGPAGLVPVAGIGLNVWVVGFAISVSSVASLFFGLIPAVTTSTGVNDVLKESARGATAGRRRFREAMVAIQVAASLVLLVCAGLLLRSFLRVQDADPGFNARNVLTFELQLPASHYGEPERRIAFYEAFRSRLQALPGVVSVGSVDRIPFGGPQGGSPLRVVGRAVDRRSPEPILRPSRISPGYFESLGVPLRRGRYFTAADATNTTSVAIIDDATARRFFPDEDPIGRQVTGVEPGLTATIVGVVGSVKRRDLSSAPEMAVYHTTTQKVGAAMTYTVKTATDPLSMIPAIRHEITELDPLLPLTRIVTMEQRLSDSLARRRLSLQLMSFFGLAALLLAATGLYGVLSYVVNQRRREVVIRVALGARPRQVIELVARQGLLSVALGIVGGL